MSAAVGAVGYQTGVEDQDLSVGGLVGGLLSLFLACLVGGWVAGRMARRKGGLHGLVSALWLVLLAALLAGLAALAGDRYDVTERVGLPGWFDRGALAPLAIGTGLLALALMLLGGLARRPLGPPSPRHRDGRRGRDAPGRDRPARRHPRGGGAAMSEHAGRPADEVRDRLARDDDAVETTRSEERAVVGTELHETGRVRVRKHVETYPVEETVSRSIEHADTSERLPALEGDNGEVQTLEDGSVSIPVFEEVLVVTKKLVVRERVVVRKRTVVDEHTLQTELRREHVTVDAEGDVGLVEDEHEGGQGGVAR